MMLNDDWKIVSFVTATFDQQNLLTPSLDPWKWMPNLKNFWQGVTVMSRSQEWDGQTAQKHSNSSHD